MCLNQVWTLTKSILFWDSYFQGKVLYFVPWILEMSLFIFVGGIVGLSRLLSNQVKFDLANWLLQINIRVSSASRWPFLDSIQPYWFSFTSSPSTVVMLSCPMSPSWEKWLDILQILSAVWCQVCLKIGDKFKKWLLGVIEVFRIHPESSNHEFLK